MTTRRRFLRLGLTGSAATILSGVQARWRPVPSLRTSGSGVGPVLLSTWDHGLLANAKARQVLQEGGAVLDAVEQGVMVVESDMSNRSVGLGGLPDRDGHVTLDACIQDHDCRAGSVAFLEHFEHPVSIARAVMERTPHVMLVGEGAAQWALANGFSERTVRIPEVTERWKEWLRTSEYRPGVNNENAPAGKGDATDHDTIGMLAMDAQGRMAGSCTTSGLAFKIHGRVGDSPIIGAGLFVDGDVGAACATGTGELVMRTAGSHSVVELMRQGMEPLEACREAVDRVLRKHPGLTGQQVGFLALRRDGAFGAHSIYNGFNYAITTADRHELQDAAFVRTWQ
ncbi:MAG: N(4)-(beta-N-acetylglucosaminyl)-L-asparaginase [Flavobacteriales bacterium]|nr:N(4)-(beta-N-acetylglucosaminyl)-L-asparaginase [Flavobacteriales bacterium]MCB9168169.1 N(4)-(beta-N-acetylglucosaminyl)-L-asparaginase [Flavobacteriales bacterium]MCB9194266.1 N(4)-(beta-N-acetylglucosaminyl)-L-asparaginase [Flavobacteriales bacterium]